MHDAKADYRTMILFRTEDIAPLIQSSFGYGTLGHPFDQTALID